MVMYDYVSNVIISELIKNCQEATICNAFLKMHKILQSRGSDPKFYIMDNECSIDLKEAMKKYAIDFQLAPPHMCRQNEVERTITTCNNNFISGFSTTDLDFPISEWD